MVNKHVARITGLNDFITGITARWKTYVAHYTQGYQADKTVVKVHVGYATKLFSIYKFCGFFSYLKIVVLKVNVCYVMQYAGIIFMFLAFMKNILLLGFFGRSKPDCYLVLL